MSTDGAPRQDNVSETPTVTRPARALIGWLQEDQALLVLAGQRRDASLSEEMANRARGAREAVAARPATTNQTGAVLPAPADISLHIDRLKQFAAAKPYFDEGWYVALVDLQKICALQPHVFVDHADERASLASSGDLESVAAVTLPISADPNLPAQFDQIRQTWIISGRNPNLRIVGNWAGPIQPGLAGFGFAVTILPSFVQVALVEGRYILRDGYHRAVGFLRRSMPIVPALVREFAHLEQLNMQAGLLPPSVYLGDRPPLLRDYLDDRVAASVELPAFQKMIVIPGIELTPAG
jgi:hypothetical protein